jgi:hypothetical protein
VPVPRRLSGKSFPTAEECRDMLVIELKASASNRVTITLRKSTK